MKPYKLYHVFFIITSMAFAVFVLLWVFHTFVFDPIPSEEYYILLAMYSIMVVSTSVILKTRNFNNIHVQIGFNSIKLMAAIVAIGIALIIWIIDYVYQTKILNVDDSISAAIWYKRQTNIYWVFFSTAIITPIIEEMLFRGILLQSLNEYLSKFWTAIIVSLLFTLIHFDVLQIPTLLFASIIYVWLTYKYKSIIPAIIAHIINNSLTFFYYISIIGI